MRTSRVARDTARLVNALSPRKTRSRDPKLQSLDKHEDIQDATPLEDAVSTDPVPVKSETVSPTSVTPTRKRKRATTLTDTPTLTRVTEEPVTTAQISPKRTNASQPNKLKKAKRQPAKKVVGASGDIKIEPPPNWETIYNLTREMRKAWLAPVDTMGCENLAEETRSPRDQRFQTLVALMLSSQTKDTVTSVAMKNLQEQLPGGFNLESVLAVEPATLNMLISKVGFHNNKTKYIKAASEVLRDNYESDIPDTIEGLVSLPGVGPKMAYLCMSAAWGRDEGIGVDVHVHRITNLWGWHKTKEPEETRAALESWLPREKWHDINHLLVGFGQTYCPPVGKRCESCKLAQHGLCPSAVVGKNFTIQSLKQEVLLEDAQGEVATISNKQDLEVQVKTIKAEDLGELVSERLETSVPDIEDIGKSVRRSRRLGR